MEPILSEYKKYQRELVKKYGERSVVLLQVGSFYEIYSVENDFGKTEQVSKILNILQTLKFKIINLIFFPQHHEFKQFKRPIFFL